MCHKQLDIGNVLNLEMTADFECGNITSDAGGLLLKEIDDRYLGSLFMPVMGRLKKSNPGI